MRKLKQKGRYHFEIEWSDDIVQVFRLSDVQQNCPCAICMKKKEVNVDPEVMAVKLSRVGSYALKFQFTRGCSRGIYPFTLLREIEW